MLVSVCIQLTRSGIQRVESVNEVDQQHKELCRGEEFNEFWGGVSCSSE